LLYADSPDHKVRGHSERFCAKIRHGLTAALGADRPARIVEKFSATVMGGMREIEAGVC
jgi:hypothetical protein